MTAATVAFLMPVSRFRMGVYSSVAAALSAMTVRSSGWPFSTHNETHTHVAAETAAHPGVMTQPHGVALSDRGSP